jgi:hypothetical protein
MIEDDDLILGDDMTVLDRMESLLAPAGAGDAVMEPAEAAAYLHAALAAGVIDPKSELFSVLKEALEAAIATGFVLPPINVEARTLPPVVQPEPPDQPYGSPVFARRLEIRED